MHLNPKTGILCSSTTIVVTCFFKQRGPDRKLSFGCSNSTIFNSLVLLSSFPKFWRVQETNSTTPKSGESDYCQALSAIINQLMDLWFGHLIHKNLAVEDAKLRAVVVIADVNIDIVVYLYRQYND